MSTENSRIDRPLLPICPVVVAMRPAATLACIWSESSITGGGTDTATGNRRVGVGPASRPSASGSSTRLPKLQLPSPGLPRVLMVTSTVTVPPAGTRTIRGEIDPAMSSSCRRQACSRGRVLRNVRVKVQLVKQSALPRLGWFNADTSPPVAGLAAR